jgi:hypothetical protein
MSAANGAAGEGQSSAANSTLTHPLPEGEGFTDELFEGFDDTAAAGLKSTLDQRRV